MKGSEFFGLTIFGNGATTLRALFVNTLVTGVHDEAGLLDIADCVWCVAKSIKKDTECITKFFVHHMERLDPDKIRCVNFPISS